MIPDDRATLIRLWLDPKYKLTPEEAQAVEDAASDDHNSMPMVLRGKARLTLIREGQRRVQTCPK
jgi:hypothetical protein